MMIKELNYVGEPEAWHQVCAGGVAGVHITPLGSSSIHSPAVTLHLTLGVSEGEGAALTPAVDEGRGGLVVSVHRLTGAGQAGADEDQTDEESLELLHVDCVDEID